MKTLKQILKFYLGSWWLPPLLILLGSILTDLFVYWRMPPTPHLSPELNGAVALALYVHLFFVLGWLASWIWLLCHKRWIKALLSFLFTALLLIPIYLG